MFLTLPLPDLGCQTMHPTHNTTKTVKCLFVCFLSKNNLLRFEKSLSVPALKCNLQIRIMLIKTLAEVHIRISIEYIVMYGIDNMIAHFEDEVPERLSETVNTAAFRAGFGGIL